MRRRARISYRHFAGDTVEDILSGARNPAAPAIGAAMGGPQKTIPAARRP